MQTLETDNGSTLAWTELGASDGRPVIGWHGIASSHRQLTSAGLAAHRLGIRLLVLDRPGYGASTFRADRRLTDGAADLHAVCDHLGIDTVDVLGVSAGAPFALAALHGAPDRVAAGAVLSSPAPGMLPDTRSVPVSTALYRMAAHAPRLLVPVLRLLTAGGRRWPRRFVDARWLALPPADRAVLSEPEVRRLYECEAHAATPTTACAIAQDLTLLVGDWGFDPTEVTAPVTFLHGVVDREAPIGDTRRLVAAMPDGRLVARAGGHLSYVHSLSAALGELRPPARAHPHELGPRRG